MAYLDSENFFDREHFLSVKPSNKEKRNIFTPLELIYIYSLLSKNIGKNIKEDENNKIDNQDD
jgi:hypothetical protein